MLIKNQQMRFVHLHKNFSARLTTGKKWREFEGGNFLPACCPALLDSALKKRSYYLNFGCYLLSAFSEPSNLSEIFIRIFLKKSSDFVQRPEPSRNL